jgi:hypothetical protein
MSSIILTWSWPNVPPLKRKKYTTPKGQITLKYFSCLNFLPTCPHFILNYVLVAKSIVMSAAIWNYTRTYTHAVHGPTIPQPIYPVSFGNWKTYLPIPSHSSTSWNVWTPFPLNWDMVQKNTIPSESGQRQAPSSTRRRISNVSTAERGPSSVAV